MSARAPNMAMNMSARSARAFGKSHSNYGYMAVWRAAFKI